VYVCVMTTNYNEKKY